MSRPPRKPTQHDQMWFSVQAMLDQLEMGGSAADIERCTWLHRGPGVTDEDQARLDKAAAQLVRIRDVLQASRRREAELAALFETAGDLAALRDLDSVLRAIVGRTRQLLNCDVAYLTMADPERGDTYMRITAGSVSPAFQRLRLGLGEGLGGLVAQRGEAHWTDDYPHDAQFNHTGPIDGAVGEEGLIAICGAPLMIGRRVIGVLYGSDRSTRQFTPAEVALLCTFAAHAALAIESTDLLEATRGALTDLHEANEMIRTRSAEVERASAAHDRLTELALRGGQAVDVARAVAQVLGGRVTVLGADDAPLPGSGPSEADPQAAPDVAAALAEARDTGRAARAGAVWVASATAGREHLGALVLRGLADPELSEADRRILERAGMVTALLLLFARTVTEAEHRVRGELLTDLLHAPDRDPAALRDRALRLSNDLDAPQVLVAVPLQAGAEDDRARLRSAASHLAAVRHGLAGEYEGYLVLLLPGVDAGAAAREAAAELGYALRRPLTAGAAPAEGGPPAVLRAYRQARSCAEALAALGRTGQAAALDELGFLGLLLSDRRDLAGFVRSAIGPLLDYDDQRGTELLRTAEVYFESGGNLTRAKARLHVHVNTVTQRLDRIGQLLGEGWQHADRALEVHLAIRLHRLAGSGSGSGAGAGSAQPGAGSAQPAAAAQSAQVP